MDVCLSNLTRAPTQELEGNAVQTQRGHQLDYVLDSVDGHSHSFPSSLDFLPEDSIFDCNVQILLGLLSMTRRAAFPLCYTVMEPLPSRTRFTNRRLEVQRLTAIWDVSHSWTGTRAPVQVPAVDDTPRSDRAEKEQFSSGHGESLAS